MLEWREKRGGGTRGGWWRGVKGRERGLGKRVVLVRKGEEEEEEGFRGSEVANMVVVGRGL